MKTFEEIEKTPNIVIKGRAGNTGIGGSYYDSISGKWLNFMFSNQLGWEHLSVSTPNKTPTWDQMCKMKSIFWNDDETCVEYHPAKDQYVNMHPHCLHIWRPIHNDQFINEPTSKEELLPVPPHFLVGFKDDEEKRQFLELAKLFDIKINPFE